MQVSQRQLDVLRAHAITVGRSGLLGFTKYTKPDYEINWHHRVLCDYLDRFYRREIRRLIITMPPRHGKSEQGSRRLPAFIFGKNPDASIIGASYGADLASRMNRDIQRIMDDDRYLRLFPETRLNGDNVRATSRGALRNNDIFEIVGHRGVYRSVGVGGGITGMGAEYLIIDDPIKSQDEADSLVYRDRTWEWFGSVAYTRLEKDGCILIILTRWHEDDIAGRVIAKAKEDPLADSFTILNLPAICEGTTNPDDPRIMGEALWPNKYDINRLGAIRATVGSRVWNALYQQRPAATEGNLIKREWLRYWDRLPERFEEQLISVDATFTGKATSDFVAMQVWGRFGARKYLLDQVYARMGITDTISALIALCAKWPGANLKLIENKANGPAIEDLLSRQVSGIVLWEPRGDKIARMNAVSPQFEAGNVFLPLSIRGPWIDALVDELVTFPNAAHDDRCDALTQALLRLEESVSAGVGTIRILR